MLIRSLGCRTDLFFARFDGQVLDRESYTLVRTPANPSFYWGNFLFFEKPPTVPDFERWRALFEAEFRDLPAVRHITFGWDDLNGAFGEIGAFLDAGFELEESVVLTTRRVHQCEKYNHDVQIRPLREDWEWAAALDSQVAGRDLRHDEAGHRIYMTRQLERHRALVEAGCGHWFGAFFEGQVVASLGLFVFEGVGRFQMVSTHPDFRRRGICGALVHQAAQFGLEQLGAETLVMIADTHYYAAKIYESVGFAPTERLAGLLLPPR